MNRTEIDNFVRVTKKTGGEFFSIWKDHTSYRI